MTMRDLLTAAAHYYVNHNLDNNLVEILDVADQWYDLLETPLEDLRLSRLDLEGMEQDFISIGGNKL